jgi:hypothetical protein
MQNNLTGFDRFLGSKTTWTYELILRLSPIEWATLCGLAVMVGIIAFRLGRFTKPESPRFSQFIRHTSRLFLLWPSVTALLSVTLLWSFFFALCYTLSVVPNGLAALHSQIVAIGWGVLSGLLAGALGFYWLIPGSELPASSNAAPDAKPSAMGNYNPEKYFRV